MNKLRELLAKATAAPWLPVDGKIYFPKVMGGFSLTHCPQPEGNVQLIAYLRNNAETIADLIDAAKLKYTDTGDVKALMDLREKRIDAAIAKLEESK